MSRNPLLVRFWEEARFRLDVGCDQRCMTDMRCGSRGRRNTKDTEG